MPYILSRLFFILLGYAPAAISSGFVLALALAVTGSGFGGRTAMPLNEFFAVGMMASGFIALYAAPFAAIVVAVGEWMAIRKKRYYAIAGSVIGLILSVLFYVENWFPFVGGGYGSVAGLIYWWVAGHRAGFTDAALKAENRVGLAVLIGLVILAGLAPIYVGLGSLISR
jgi:uncharacterized membrane protein